MITSDKISFRLLESDQYVMGDAGPACYAPEQVRLALSGALNSSVVDALSKMINPTLNWSAGVVASFPIPRIVNNEGVALLVEKCVDFAKFDWDSFETSWDFKRHPLV